MVPYFSMQKNLVVPLQKYAKIIDSPVYAIDEITGGPVWAKVWNNRWSRYKFPGPVFPQILTGPKIGGRDNVSTMDPPWESVITFPKFDIRAQKDTF